MRGHGRAQRVNADAVSGDPAKVPGQGAFWISSHHVYNQPNDPILNACQRLGLDNRPENHVQVIFDPAQLDGKDGFLNMRYDEVLAACDLGVFPSWYEPWGYTPQESAAHAVPTVTTDLSGFGLWVRSSQREKNGVTILCRRQTSYDETAASLRDVLCSMPPCPKNRCRNTGAWCAMWPKAAPGNSSSPTMCRPTAWPWTRRASAARSMPPAAAIP